MSPRSKKPTLLFGPSSSFVGFTSYETSAFDDVEPAKVIRELIQNSLDAAVEAGEDTAIVRFCVKGISRSDVPDLQGYEKAFKSAVKFQGAVATPGQLADTAQEVVARIRRGLRELKDGKHHALTVIDNGIGLDDRRMHSILGNGASAKVDGTGSYGVGHLAAISTSDLRYVLYGAVQSGGKRIAAGNTVLASMPGKAKASGWLSADGYLVASLLNGSGGCFYEFLAGGSIPGPVESAIDDIEQDWGHGTVVMIPSFNHFRDQPHRLWEIVSTVVSRNFNVALFEGKLVVEVDDAEVRREQDGDTCRRLDDESLQVILDRQKEERRVPRADSLFGGLKIAGQTAYMTYEALSEGQVLPVDTTCGSAEIHVLAPSLGGRTRIDLYRNGMWVTHQIPRLEVSDFTDHEPFCAVLKVTRDSGELYRLVRKAEGPMHDKLDFKRLSPDERRQLRLAISEIAERIRATVPEKSDEGYVPDDYLVVSEGDSPAGGTKSFSFWGSPEVVPRRTRPAAIVVEENGGGTVDPGPGPGPAPGPGPGPGPQPGPGPTTKTRSYPPLDFRSIAVPDRKGNCAIALVTNKPLEDVVMSLRVDENSDATCDRIGADESVRLTSVSPSEGAASFAQTPSLYGGGDGIRLRGLEAGVSYEVDVGFTSPAGLDESVEAPVFRVELRQVV